MKRPPSARKTSNNPETTTGAERVPVLRPLLPPVDRLLPYLRRIDTSRTYTNWGPLACELERRLSQHFGLPENGVVSAGSGTAALVGAILAASGRARPERPLALVPALTFVATAIAVEQSGYKPYLVDVDPETWLLDPDRLSDHVSIDSVGLVVPVSAFGRPVRQDAWLAFRKQTGIPVAIDGAASFEAVSAGSKACVGPIPIAMSFHATKSFGTGEGGCVLTTDSALSMRTAQALNFGFYGSRSSESASTNGKMSEYHAAIGLAELDGWSRKRLALLAVGDRYREHAAAAGIADRLVCAPDVAGCYALLRCANRAEAARVQESLAESNVEFRLWYGHGLLDQPYFSSVPHDPLEATHAIAPCVLSLPVAVDLQDATIARIISAVCRGLEFRP